jgi:predicted RNA-binding Zn-ribbon protein involved in translation (DUF1610 family)
MINTTNKTQKTIETFLQTPLTIVLNNNSTFEQIFSDAEDWIFEEGVFRFMLNPVNRRWLFWDSFHNDWEDTGHYAGEVKFIWDGNELLTPKASSSTSDPARDADAKMVVVNDSAQEHPVFANTLIGNERNSDIKIEDTESKGLILQHAGGFSFFAIGKKDAILVNHKSVPQEGVLLHEGDQVTLGETEFYFVNIPKTEETKGIETDDVIIKTKQGKTKTKQQHTLKLQCNNCHTELYEGQKFCTDCGRKIDNEVSKKFCPNCGVEIIKGQKFCTGCGEKL